MTTKTLPALVSGGSRPARFGRRIAVVAASAALGTGALAAGAGPAGAAPDAAAPLRHGIVTASGGENGRSFPTMNSPVAGNYPHGARISIDCKVHGPSVGGNDLWYGVPITGSGRSWVSARFVRNDGPAPDFCNPSDGYVAGTATSTLNRRSGPSVRDRIVGSVVRGGRVRVGCYVGPARDRWYYTDRGQWVSAPYVRVDQSVRFCANRSDV